MAYEKQTWTTGEVITQEKLNHMEDGIANAGGGIIEKVFLGESTVSIGENSGTLAAGGALLGDASKTLGEILDGRLLLSIVAEPAQGNNIVGSAQVTSMQKTINGVGLDFVADQRNPDLLSARDYSVYGVFPTRVSAVENATAMPSGSVSVSFYGICLSFNTNEA